MELCKYLISDVFDPERGIESFIVQALQKYTKPVAGEMPTMESKVEG